MIVYRQGMAEVSREYLMLGRSVKKKQFGKTKKFFLEEVKSNLELKIHKIVINLKKA